MNNAKLLFLLPLIGVTGFALASLISLPAAMITGPVMAAAICSQAFGPLKMPFGQRGEVLLYQVLGCVVGARVPPETLSYLSRWPITLAGVLALLPLLIASTTAFLVFICRWNKQAAFFASIPGALPMVLALADEYKTEAQPVVTAQTLRLVLLVALMPVVLGDAVGDMSSAAPASSAAMTSNIDIKAWQDYTLLFALAALAAFLAKILRFPAAALTGPLFSSLVLYLSGTVSTPLPEWLALACYILLGAQIGSRAGVLKPAALLRWSAASIGALLVASFVAAVFALLLSEVAGLPFSQVFLAYTPGGQEVMIMLAALSNLDPAFVLAHQLCRFLFLLLIFPWITRAVLGPAGKRPANPE